MLVEFMDEYQIDSLEPLADAILAFSERSMRDELRAIRNGVYRNQILVEGFGEPVTLACKVTIVNGEAERWISRGYQYSCSSGDKCASLLHKGDDLLRAEDPDHAKDTEQRGIGATGRS